LIVSIVSLNLSVIVHFCIALPTFFRLAQGP
jgi:hypothetical protein